MNDITNVTNAALSATSIGALFRKAHITHLESVRFAIECGARLIAKKASLEHGEWLPWLKANSEILGFGGLAAQRLMKVAGENPSLATDLKPDEAIKLNRVIWGHAPKATPRISYESMEDSSVVATVQAGVPESVDRLKRQIAGLKRDMAKLEAENRTLLWRISSQRSAAQYMRTRGSSDSEIGRTFGLTESGVANLLREVQQ